MIPVCAFGLPNAKQYCDYSRHKNTHTHTHTHAKTHTFGVTVEDTLEILPRVGFPATAEDNIGAFFTFKHHTDRHKHTQAYCVVYSQSNT